MIPEVVNIRTCHPRFGQTGDVRIDRVSKWGNPYVMHHESERNDVLQKYEMYIRSNVALLDALPELAKARRLGCWCKPKACHGDILIKLMKERDL